jgi:PAS domain S-box-containing protein
VKQKETSLRKFGIELVGDVPWGTHLCQFYETKEDLIDILVPYLAEGLRNNEFCIWITSPPLEVEEAKRALRKAIPELDQYIQKGQIEILPYTKWYLLGGEFDADRVLQGWAEKEKVALSRGFDGLRLTGNTFWVERSLWKSFADYEAAVNAVITLHRIIALCTYSLKKCTGTDTVDVLRNHVGTLIRRERDWYMVEDVAHRKQAEEELAESELRYRSLFANMNSAFAYHKIVLDDNGEPVDYVFLELNEDFEKLTGLRKEEILGKRVTEVLPGIERDPADWIGTYGKVAISGEAVRFENYSQNLKKWYSISAYSPSKGYFATAFDDITERKQAEIALREGEQRWATTLSSIGDAVIATDLDGKVTFMNTVAETLAGWTLKEASQKPLREVFRIINEQSRLEVEDPVATVLEKGVIVGLANHTILVRKDGTEVAIDDSGAPIRDEKGEIAGVVLVFRDITERKEAEEALRESQKDLNRAQIMSKTGSWRLDVLHDELLWSDETHRMFGVPLGTPMTYETFLIAVHPDDREYVDQKWKAALHGEPYDIEHRIVVDGEVKWVRERAELEFDKDGALLGGFGTIQDITERKQMRDKLEDYAKHLEELVEERTKKLALSLLYARSLIEASLDPLVTISAEGKITDVNRATEIATGCSKEELISSDFSDYFTEPEKAMTGYKRVFNEGFVRDYPLAIRHKSGKITDVLYNATVYRNEAGEIQGVFAAARDITELKKAEKLAQESARKLKDAERLATIGATAGMVGHDIRNPLQSIIGDVYLAKMDLASLPDSEEKKSMRESLEAIGKQTEYINKIVLDLQDFAKPLNPHAEETDLERLIDDLLVRNGVPKNIQTDAKVDVDAKKVMADSAYMKRIMGNLISNAIQAMPDGGKLAMRAYREAGDVVITVEDTGIGIPDEAKPKLFQPLFTTKSKGQGFGLAVVKRLTEALNGTITFDSQEGKGTKFAIKLPTGR